MLVATGRAHHAELGERAEAEDEARPEQDVEDVAEPQHAHRDRRVARAAEHRVDQEQQHDGDVAAEHDAREAEPVAIISSLAPIARSRRSALKAPITPR